MSEVVVRRFVGADTVETVEVFKAIYAATSGSYPLLRECSDAAVETWLANKKWFGRWVAVAGSGTAKRVVGHVGSCSAASDTSRALWTDALGVETHKLSVISRLGVSPAAQRSGVAWNLLKAAVEQAQVAGNTAVLDVAASNVTAIRLYQAFGFEIVATSTGSWDGKPLEIAVLVYCEKK